MITAILSASENWGIGRDGGLLFHIPEDMKFFRETTEGHTVVMGRKTLESLPGGKPLKNRKNIVMSERLDYAPEGVTVLHGTGEFFEYISENTREEIFIIGGGEIYRLLLPYCDRALVTRVYAGQEADTFFPDLDRDPRWVMTEQSEEKFCGGLKFRFCTYEIK